MKKKFFWAAFALLTAVVPLSSCGDDDDDEPKTPQEQTDNDEEQEEPDDPSKIYPGFYYYQDDDYLNSYWFKGDSVIINSFDRNTFLRAPINLRGKFRIDGDSLRLSFNKNQLKMAFGFKRVSKDELRISGDINATLKRNIHYQGGKTVFFGPYKEVKEYGGLCYFFGCKDSNGKIGVLESLLVDKYYSSYSIDGDVLRMKGETTKELLARQIGENEFQIGATSCKPFGHYLELKRDRTYKYKGYSLVITYSNGERKETYVTQENIVTFYGNSPWQMHYKETAGSDVKYDLDCSYYIDDNKLYINRVGTQSIKFNSDSTTVTINGATYHKQ